MKLGSPSKWIDSMSLTATVLVSPGFVSISTSKRVMRTTLPLIGFLSPRDLMLSARAAAGAARQMAAANTIPMRFMCFS